MSASRLAYAALVESAGIDPRPYLPFIGVIARDAATRAPQFDWSWPSR